jgi:uncharacterized protein YprB with RNaseH-like and TPR domain
MDRASLAARIQEILKSRPKPPADDPRADGGIQPGPVGRVARPPIAEGDEEAAFAARCAAAEASSRVLEVLGATLVEGIRGPCVVVDRSYPASYRHGRQPVERYLAAARASRLVLPWFLKGAGILPMADGADVEPRLLCFDLETTGLSGGAGTYAFLVGFGVFDDEGFHTRQFFLRGYGEERALLHAVEDEISTGLAERPSVLVTYNGRSFDVPLIETRYQIHRLQSPFDQMAHVDMLFPARRLWKRRGPRASPSGGGAAFEARVRPFGAMAPDESPGSCALTAIERDILGLHRQDDVPGWEIPARYFGYARTGDARGLEAVLEHNRLDLLSLGAVAAVILEMVREGAEAARERHDCLALGRLLEYLGRLDEAERCFAAAAIDDGMLESGLDRIVRADALHWLALHHRRSRRFQEAAEAWRALTEINGVDAELRREALEALAIHYEHRAKDLEAARRFALRALDLADDASRVDGVRHRLGRLSRKLSDGSGHPDRLRP